MRRASGVAMGLAFVALGAACGGDKDSNPGTGTDAAVRSDAALLEAGPFDAGSDAPEAVDAGVDASSMSDAGVDAFVDLDAGPPLPNPDDVVRAMVRWDSCVPTSAPGRALREFYYLLGHDDAQAVLRDAISCLASAADGCAAIERCTGVTATPTESTTEGCVGDRVIRAAFDGVQNIEVSFDCSRIGRTCEPLTLSCVLASSAACDVESFVERCEASGSPVACEGREQLGPECDAYGLTCEVTADPTRARCTGTIDPVGGACAWEDYGPARFDLGFGTQCVDANTLEYCVGGKLARIDCRTIAMGFGCQSYGDKGGPHYFCGLASDCHGLYDTSSRYHDDDNVSVCNAGRLDTIDCPTLGFAGADFLTGLCVTPPPPP